MMSDSGLDYRRVYLANMSAEPFRQNVDFDEKPRQVSIGFFLVGTLLAWLATQPELISTHLIQDTLPGAGFRTAMWALLFFLVVYCALLSKNSPMLRPHPMFWRALHGWNIWYCALAVVMLVVPIDDGEILMQWIFPSGRNDLAASGTVGFDHLACEITPATVWRQVSGIWFMAHLLGWCAKMLMLRDWKMCLVYSTCFELTELTLQFLIPEFQECWWDSILMDWGGANLIGMLVGAMVLRRLNASEYKWRRIGETTGFKNRSKRFIQQFSPYAWIRYEWNPDSDPRGLVLNALVWMVMALGEVNSFFLLNIIRLPNDHLFNKVRQMLLVFTAMPAVAEWYHFQKGHTQRIGHFMWLITVTVILETAAIARYWIMLPHLKKELPGFAIWAPWTGFVLIFSVYFGLHCVRCLKMKQKGITTPLRLLRFAAFLPLLALLRLYAF